MIGFFRRIRRRLADEIQFKKYSRYAIGEIVLVMVGILLALQVNNWNEERKETIAQDEAIRKLKIELENDIERLTSLDSLYNSWNKQADYILNEILDKSEQINSLQEIIVGRGSMNYFTITTTTYDEMVNTGTLYKLRDKDLSQIIGKYYDFANNEIMLINQDNQMFYDYTLDNNVNLVNTVLRLKYQRNFETIDWSWLKNPNSEKYKEMESYILFHLSAIEATRLLISQLIEKTEEVIISINNYNKGLN
jgi:hypothetical protein